MRIHNADHGKSRAKGTIIYSDTDRVWCMGEDMDHPKVYYTIPQGGEVVCGYCDIVFRRREEE